MNRYENMTREELSKELSEICEKLGEYGALGMSLDLTRGKPGNDQLDISEGMLDVVSSSEDCVCENGVDCRNYGILDGIPEAKRLFSELLGIPKRNLIVE